MPKGGAKIVDRFLPLQPLSTPSESSNEIRDTRREEAIRHFYANVSFPIPNEASSSEPLFPGQQYKIYNATDHNSLLPKDFGRVLQLVSKVTGIQSSVIESAVYKMEMTFMRKELGWKTQLTQLDQIPPQGVETQMFGRMREMGGTTPWPREILPSAKMAKPEKEKALLAPKMVV